MLESAVPGFSIKGNADEVCAQLKAALEARDARFNACLEALFKPAQNGSEPAPKSIQPAPATPARSSGASHETTGFSLSRKADRGLRNSRLR